MVEQEQAARFNYFLPFNIQEMVNINRLQGTICLKANSFPFPVANHRFQGGGCCVRSKPLLYFRIANQITVIVCNPHSHNDSFLFQNIGGLQWDSISLET